MFKPDIKHVLNFLVAAFCLLPVAGVTFAQQVSKADVKDIMDSVAGYTAHCGAERLYLQTDKSMYASGDTIWFKGYLFDAAYLNAGTKSGIVYIELANDSNRVIQRLMLPVYNGLTAGSIAIDKEAMPARYTLRGYSNWMRNFDEKLFFKKYLHIGRATAEDWLIAYNTRLEKEEGSERAELAVKMTQLDKNPVGLREMKITVKDGKKSLLKRETRTTIDGLLAVGFDVSGREMSDPIVLDIEDLTNDRRKLVVPLLLNRPEHTDLQFMPEGGNLVAGHAAHVAFKALNEDGTGAGITGKICNSKSVEVADFTSSHMGIGTFRFLPLEHETYVAKVKLPDGAFKTYPLPVVSNTGITLHVENAFSSDSCEVFVNASADIAASGRGFYLIGHTRGVVCFGASIDLKKGWARLKLSKEIFPSGVARISLIGAARQVLNERVLYIDHSDGLNVQVTTDKQVYGQRDSITLRISATDKSGMPVQGSFSLAVTDNGQVETDSITQGSMISHMLLTADLKGQVEGPGYYDGPTLNEEKWQHLDQLLLAQGWAGYDIADAFKPAKVFDHAAEQEFLIKGRVTNAFNKPVPNSGVTLFSKNPLLVIDTVSNELGNFTFKHIYPVDTAVYFIQARNKKGKSFNVGIEMDEFVPHVFLSANKPAKPWYVNIDTGLYGTETMYVNLKKEQERVTGVNMLEEVVVIGQKTVKGSKNLNGPGAADVIIDEAELQKSGRTSLGDLLTKHVKGFGYRANKQGVLYYQINSMLVHLVIDGMDTEFFLPEGTSTYQHFKQFFDYYDAEEIMGIEVMYTGKYQMSYTSRFLNPMDAFYDHAFIEVTTRGGKGPFLKKSVGTYLFRPMPFASPYQFYAPKYTAASVADMTDIRSTIHWEPHIVTGSDGKATLRFYAADNPGTYTLIIEGADMQGNMGVRRQQIVIKKKLPVK